MKQLAIVVIETNGLEPYNTLKEHPGALFHFFEDIDYRVENIHFVDCATPEQEKTALGHLNVLLKAVQS